MKPYLLLLLLFTACKKDPKIWESYEDLSYGPYERNVLDVFLPDEHDQDTKMVILVHGGGWIAGDKKSWPVAFRDTFLEHGFAVAFISYLYACGDFHKQMEDISNAIRLVKKHAAEWKFSGDEFALLGASAGGHLALLYAHAFDNKKEISTVVSLVGPTDLADSLLLVYAGRFNLTGAIEQLVGGSLDEIPEEFKAASPIYNYSDVPSFFIHGKLDPLVPAEQGVRMYDTLVEAGIIADTTILPAADHNVFGPDNLYWDRVNKEIIEWLNLYLLK